MATRFFLGLFFSLIGVQAGAEGKSRPMSEMRGGCADFKMDLSSEMKAWEGSATPVTVHDKSFLPFSTKLALSLKSQKDVDFINKPGKTFSAQGPSYGGVFSFVAAESGTLRVSAGSRVWFDVVETGARKTLETDEFEMQSGCEKIFKSVAFKIRKGERYALQVSGSAKDEALFILTMAR